MKPLKNLVPDFKTLFNTQPIPKEELENILANTQGGTPEKKYHRAVCLFQTLQKEYVIESIQILKSLLDESRVLAFHNHLLYFIASGYYVLDDIIASKSWLLKLLKLYPNYEKATILMSCIETIIREERKQRKENKQQKSKTQLAGNPNALAHAVAVKQQHQSQSKFGFLNSFNSQEANDDDIATPTFSPAFALELENTMRKLREKAQTFAKKEDLGKDVKAKDVFVRNYAEISSRLSKEETENLVKCFKAMDTMDTDDIDKEQFVEGVGLIGISSNEFLYEYIFTAFEIVKRNLASSALYKKNTPNNSDMKIAVIDAEAFVTTYAILIKGTDEERLSLSFQILDKAQKGHVTKRDIFDLVTSAYELLSRFGIETENAWTVTSAMFDALNSKDGKVDFESFKSGVLQNYNLFSCLGCKFQSQEYKESVPKCYARGARAIFGSKSWNTVLEMMLGVRLSGAMLKPIQRKILYQDFYVKLKFFIPSTNAPEDSTFEQQSSKYVEYAPRVFQKIRESLDISDFEYFSSFSPENFLGSFVLGSLAALSFQESDGKSGSLFYFTPNGKFIIKNIPGKEFKSFTKMIPDYYKHITLNPYSLLTKFLGCFKVNNMGFIVMNNVLASSLPIHEIYDLKGSKVSRSNPDGPVYKDLDLTSPINLGPNRQILLNIASNDLKFLIGHQFTDYSLLVGIHYKDKSEYEKSQNQKQLLKQKGKQKKSDDKDASKSEGAESDEEAADESEEGQAEDSPSTPSTVGTRKRSKGIKVSNAPPISTLEDGDANETTKQMNTQISQTTNFTGLAGAELFDKSYNGGIRSQDGKKIFYIGIIDTLTNYDFKKQAELNFKTLRYGIERRNEISAQPPQEYGDRLKKYLFKIIE